MIKKMNIPPSCSRMFKTKNSQIIIDTLAAVDTFLLDYKYIQTSDCRAVESYSPAREILSGH